jgi:hypothetical protein
MGCLKTNLLKLGNDQCNYSEVLKDNMSFVR